jgi:hypothetical protein
MAGPRTSHEEADKVPSFTLYEPDMATNIVAIYSHGALKELIDPLGVTLKYYCEHGISVVTSVTEAHERGDATHDPKMPNDRSGKWVNYTLTEITQLRAGPEFLAQAANTTGWAIAYVTSETDTATIVGELAAYSEIRGVHCRVGYSLGVPFEIAQTELEGGWKDVNFESITATNKPNLDDTIFDGSTKPFQVYEVISDEKYKIQERVPSRG